MLTVFGHQKKNSCQTLFAGIEKLTGKICLHFSAMSQEVVVNRVFWDEPTICR